jgi:hypothetical protein
MRLSIWDMAIESALNGVLWNSYIGHFMQPRARENPLICGTPFFYTANSCRCLGRAV